MFTDEFWLGDEEEIFAFDVVGHKDEGRKKRKHMARLTAATRRAMPGSKFAGPGKTYPINDATHARLAKSGASRAEHVGNISKATENRIDRKADRVLGVNPSKAGSAVSADGIRHNPLFTTRGQNQSC